MKPVNLRWTLFCACAFLGCAIALGAWCWLSLPDWKPLVRGRAFSSFDVPDRLDESEFTQRLVALGFVAVNDADFNSLLPREYQENAIASGKPASNFNSIRAFRYIGNTGSATRIVGYDPRNRKVYYFRSQVYARETGDGQNVGDTFDTIEQELRK